MSHKQVRGFRLRPATWRQWCTCLTLARLIHHGGGRDADRLLSRSLRWLEARLRAECIAAGVDPVAARAGTRERHRPASSAPPPEAPSNADGV